MQMLFSFRMLPEHLLGRSRQCGGMWSEIALGAERGVLKGSFVQTGTFDNGTGRKIPKFQNSKIHLNVSEGNTCVPRYKVVTDSQHETMRLLGHRK